MRRAPAICALLLACGGEAATDGGCVAVEGVTCAEGQVSFARPRAAVEGRERESVRGEVRSPSDASEVAVAAGERESFAGPVLASVAAPGAAVAAVDERRAACLRRNADAPARYRRIVDAFCAEHHNLEGIGASLAIAEGDAPVFVATAGDACLGGQVVTAATRFRLGSLTKLWTAALVLRQVDAGRFALDDAVARVLPELAAGVDERAAAITWRQLLQHTAGVPDPSPFELGADWLQALGERPLWEDPGALWSYSNAGYALVGAALARLRGVDFEALLVAELLAPLGLDRAVIDPELARDAGAACGHLGRGAAARAFSVVDDLALGTGNARWTAPAGGAIASAAELVAVARDLVDPRRSPLSLESRLALLAADVPTHERPGERYGLGLRARPGAGEPIFGHSGGTGDFAADLVFEPGARITAAVLTNNGAPLRATLAVVLQELLGVAPGRAAAMGPVDSYVGVYRAARASEATISARGSTLLLSVPALALAGVALEHSGDHRFGVAGRPDLGGLTFVFASGPARASDLRGDVFVGARVE